jgi:hypothetical protein
MDMRRNSCHLGSNHSMLIAVPFHRPVRRQVRYLTTNSEDTDTYSMKPDLIKQLGGNDASGQVVLHNTPSEFKAEQPTTKFIRTSKLDCSMDIDGPNKTTYDCRWLQ